jgi:hypothetical protein
MKYALIAEWKDEGPLVLEGEPLTHEQAIERMRVLRLDLRVIRVAVGSLAYDSGNPALLKGGE